MPKAVIFDVDGTLIDSNDLHAASWVEAFRHFGIETAYAEVRAQMGKGGDQLMPVFLDPDLLREGGEEISTFRSELFKRDYLPRARAFAGVRSLFERIKEAGQTVVLASSGKKEEVDHHVKAAEIGDLVDAVTTADDAECSKPEPDIFAAALERITPLNADQALVVGDSPFDAEAAAKIGLSTTGLLCGGFTEEVLRTAGCLAIYRDPADLHECYQQSPLAP
jgi:phosphoglycolate phosphatase-like HAD superfamily hydrolase